MNLSYKRFFLDKMSNQRPQTKLFGAVSALGVSILYESASPSYPKSGVGKSSDARHQGTGLNIRNGASDIAESLDNKVKLLFLRLPLLSFKRGRFVLSSGVKRSREYCYLYSIEGSQFMTQFLRFIDNKWGSNLGKITDPDRNDRLRSMVSQVRKSDF